VKRRFVFAILSLLVFNIASADNSPANVLGLVDPITVDISHMLADGGSIGGTLTDRNGKAVAFVYDGRPRFWSWLPWHKKHIFVGAHDPEALNAKALNICSKEEQAILLLVEQWVQTKYPPYWREAANGDYIARLVDDLGYGRY
jgi:hypothetical protein